VKRIISGAVMFFSAMSLSAESLVLNSGFEVESGKCGAVAWSGPSSPYSYVSGEGRNGTRTLRFDLKKDSPYAFPSQEVKLVPGAS
jgi:hypothetical protein